LITLLLRGREISNKMNPLSSEAPINNNDLTSTKVEAEEVCPICWEGFNPRDLDLVGHELIKDEKIVVVHLCHRLCIGTWLSMPSSRKRCPICSVVIQKWRAKSSGAEIESDVLPGTIRTIHTGYLFFNRWQLRHTILSEFIFCTLLTLMLALVTFCILCTSFSIISVGIILSNLLADNVVLAVTVFGLFYICTVYFMVWMLKFLALRLDLLFERRIARPIIEQVGVPG
jgi:hypothetical protein